VTGAVNLSPQPDKSAGPGGLPSHFFMGAHVALLVLTSRQQGRPE
jgi:hypothetical protein